MRREKERGREGVCGDTMLSMLYAILQNYWSKLSRNNFTNVTAIKSIFHSHEKHVPIF